MDRLYETDIVCPAATSADSPFTQQWALEDAQLLSVEVIIPAGHAGLTGIRLSRAGTVIIPFSRDSWIISDDEKLLISFNGEITQTGLTIETYNTDIWDHTFYLRAMVQDLSTSQVIAVQPTVPIPNDVISQLTTDLGPVSAG